MTYTTYPAQIRQHRIILEAETELPESAEAILIILKKQDSVHNNNDTAFLEERNAWYALGAQSLNRAYDDDEPDYSDVPLVEVNHLYRPPV
jgi:hypothetical protein